MSLSKQPFWGWVMAQWVKYLLYKPEVLSSDPQHLCKKLSTVIELTDTG